MNVGKAYRCNVISVSRDPEKDSIPVSADLREAEYQKIRGFYLEGLIRQIWLRGLAMWEGPA
jgi:hypothetical protein